MPAIAAAYRLDPLRGERGQVLGAQRRTLAGHVLAHARADAAFVRAWEGELTEARAREPSGLSRRTIAMLTRIGADKSWQKREGAVCERISKGRMQLVAALRRSGITGASSFGGAS